MRLSRRNLIKAWAAGTAALGLGGVPGIAAAASGPRKATQPISAPESAAAPNAALPKDATSITRAANAAVLDTLDFADRQSFEDAARGLVASRPTLIVKAADGREVWNLPAYAFLESEESPPSVNPSLWRQARLNMANGLFEVVEGVYQVRGFDLSNMTIVEGDTGIIVIDPLVSVEVAHAALGLYQEQRGPRDVHAVIYTHSHVDHFGGVRGVVSDADAVQILAPNGFLESAVSENAMVGTAMGRRSDYTYAPLLPKGVQGQVDAGIGKTRSNGLITIIPPTDVIAATGERRTIDGVEMVFQLAPDTEAPAEMTIYFPKSRVFDSAELACDTLHNLYTLRGAQVRDASAWSRYLNEALALYGDKTDVVISQHNWPKWGQEAVVAFLKAQRDLYKYIHDQTLRLMNQGYTAPEIAEMLTLPASLDQQWFARGYYGTVSHNVKAVYQKYLGWFDANPANLNPLPPVEAAGKYVAYMGGLHAVIAHARHDFKNGEYRWVAEVMNRVVFAYPDNAEARNLEADALEQLGYQAEAATWRNFYLMGANELRNGVLTVVGQGGSPDTIRAMTVPMYFDYLGVHLVGANAEGKHIVLNWRFTDPAARYVLNLENAALTYLPDSQAADADATLTLARATLDAVVLGQTTFQQAIVAGAIRVTGDVRKLAELMGMMETFAPTFNVVTP